jgi:type 1 fimbria pilin
VKITSANGYETAFQGVIKLTQQTGVATGVGVRMLFDDNIPTLIPTGTPPKPSQRNADDTVSGVRYDKGSEVTPGTPTPLPPSRWGINEKYLAVLLLGLIPGHADDIQVQMRATFTPIPVVDSASQNLTVDLGQAASGDFKDVGDTGEWKTLI